MSMVNLIDDLTEWVQKEVCNKLELKKPSLRGDSGYDYELVYPVAYPCFCPPQDKTNLPVSPSITVQIDGFTDDLASESFVTVTFVFSVWNTGTHDNRGGEKRFEKNLEGWRDLWQLMDMARKAIRGNFSVAGYELKSEVTGKPLVAGESAIMGTYPYFFGEVTFVIGTIESPNSKSIRDLL